MTTEPFSADAVTRALRGAAVASVEVVATFQASSAEVARLRVAQVRFRSDILSGPGGAEIILEDPSGNPVELFQTAQ